MSDGFSITQRHFELVTEQAVKCFPEETGGILGGKGMEILSIFPIINKQPEDRGNMFGLEGADLERGSIFLKKHGLEFIGLYHTHPKGIAYPSEGDLKQNQKYLFIISVSEKLKTEFRAYATATRQAIPVPLHIISNKNVEVVDIFTGKAQQATDSMQSEREKLSGMIDQMLNQKLKYDKKAPRHPFESSSFNTTA